LSGRYVGVEERGRVYDHKLGFVFSIRETAVPPFLRRYETSKPFFALAQRRDISMPAFMQRVFIHIDGIIARSTLYRRSALLVESHPLSTLVAIASAR